VPAPTVQPAPAEQDKPTSKSKYIPWAELLRKTFGFEIVCSKCHSQLRLIALIKTEAVAKTILKAMHLPTEIPELHPARPRPPPAADTGGGDDWLNVSAVRTPSFRTTAGSALLGAWQMRRRGANGSANTARAG
jgi:hypothetical protein